jgi:hypothetical protein
MPRNLIGIVITMGVLLAATGCNLQLMNGPAGDLPIEALAQTALQQTSVSKTQTAAMDAIAVPPPTASATLQPTLTFTPSITLTPTLEKFTVTVSQNTNCRTGPDKIFDLVGIMKVGETAEAIGRNEPKTYWVIRLPANTAKTCWLWYEWATVTGNGDALPIIQSPPTPTWSPKPDFTFNYVGLTPCGGNRFIRLQVTNTGNVPWESFRVKTEDTVTSTSTVFTSNVFLDYSGCTPIAGPHSLSPGETNFAVGMIPGVFSGHNVEVSLTLYTGNSSSGTNMTGNFNMTIP